MKCSVPVQLVILMATINLSRTMPQDPTTSSTARYNYLEGNTKIPDEIPRPALQIDSSPEDLALLPRRSKSPKNSAFYEHQTNIRAIKIIPKPFGAKISSAPHNNTLKLTPVRKIDGNKRTTLKPLKLIVKTTKKPTRRKTTSAKPVKTYVTRLKPFRISTQLKNATYSSAHKNKNTNRHPSKTYGKIKTRPVVNGIFTKIHGQINDELKQTWADVPVVNPMPEISSVSPPFAIGGGDSAPLDTIGDVLGSSPNPVGAIPNPISEFKLDMLPNGGSGVSSALDCPTVHISSSMLSPQQKQGCSDLNLVINSHFHQNTATQRVPEYADQVSTYDAEPVEEVPVEYDAVEADPLGDPAAADAPAADAPAADGAGAPAASPAEGASSGGSSGGAPGGGSGGSGGSGGNGGDGDDAGGGIDWKFLGDVLGKAWDTLARLFEFFKNPWLYLTPMALFFTLGFMLVMKLFPWWIPALLLFAKPKDNSHITYYKHVHKPIHHPDGWFWNHNTKTWTNVADYAHTHTVHNRISNAVPKMIEDFSRKHRTVSENTQIWKRRKKIY